MRKALHQFLSLNQNDHLDETIGFLVVGTVVAAAILSVSAIFMTMADAGVFSGPL